MEQAVNSSIVSTSYQSTLSFLGSTMPKISKSMAHAPPQHPIFFSKYDISDGFWRMVVAAGSEWNFTYVLPHQEGQPIRIVIPSALQMGWKDFPGYFCSASETVQDVAKDFVGFNGKIHDLPMHKFEQHIRTPVVDEPTNAVEEGQSVPCAAIKVFIDDFIAMCRDVPRIKQLTQSILHGIEHFFPARNARGHTCGQEHLAEKKIL